MYEGLEVNPSFLVEIWIYYALGVSVLLVRFAARLRMVGVRGFQGDDWFALVVLAMFTCDAATVHVIYHIGTNVESSVLQLERPLTDAEVARFETGSKIEVLAWYSYTALLWSLKGTMLCFFQRLTIGLWQQRLVKWIGVACVISYVAVFLTLTFGCYPTQKNWQVVPNPGLRCTFRLQNFLVTVVLNVMTDAAILCIPLPLLWKLQIPFRKKLVIAALLSSGFFVISAAIIRVVLSLSANPSATNINGWGVRETIVGIVAVNIPIIRPLFSKEFWMSNTSARATADKTSGGNTLSGAHGPYELTPSVYSKKGGSSLNGSEDNIFHRSGGDAVLVTTTYHVDTERNTPEEDRHWHGRMESRATCEAK
ncbi:hypothetical protein GGR57DRAFT_501257 [Xylariaceae sp. FL1272]|nr:hypothetical protein GGR57DRAFT_501257 [Xylariaceae sp. FL1272]